ncbi:TraI/MobA(P) family conjugative relaxase [Kluyvera intermedia]|uniref:TraI/MobA(P) family conjugative relaxase n=1 Tax=Kluyvera intermedia TaxID=61648 RepID=UPI003523373F
MIIKEIKSGKATRSVKGLIKYMFDTEHDGEKVDFAQITNCYSDDINLAVVEMNITQDKNTRTRLDKTMHLVISFPEGEIPLREQLADIEQSVADSVGLGKHQRISVAHSNTGNYHLHVAINKIDLQTYKMVNPYGNFRDMARVRESLEIKHDLQRTDKTVSKKRDGNNIDHHSGQQSLSSWCQVNIKTKVDEMIKSVINWDDIHAVLSDAGLSLNRAGRGLVIQDRENKTSIKATALSRHLSLNKLEKSIGTFRPAKVESVKESGYSKSKKSDPLFLQYQVFRDGRMRSKTEAFTRIKDTVAKQRLLARIENQLKRQQIKASAQSPAQKRNIYTRLAENNRQHLRVITASYASARKKVYADYGNMTYQQYLCYLAANGNEEALAKLRTSAQNTIKHQGLSGEGDRRITRFDAVRVDKHGVIAYQVGQHIILDNGKSLTCKDDSLMADRQLLEMAQAKYGRNLTINGSEAFKARIHAAAEQLNMDAVLNGHVVGNHDPVQQFIKNRNLDRVQNKKILYHERFTDQSGEFTYQGYRNVGQMSVVLLRQGYTLYVKDVPKKELTQYRVLTVGAKADIRRRQKANDKDRGAELD